MKHLMFLAALAAAPFAAAAANRPTSKPRWVVDWGANQCSLTREAGGTKNAGVGVQLVPGTDSVDLVVVDERWKSPPLRRSATVTIQLDGGEPLESAIHLMAGPGRFGFMAYEVDAGFLERFAKAKAISIDSKTGPLLAMPLPQIDKAVAALRACEEDALRGWGVDPSWRAALQRPATPKSTAAKFVKASDYPMEALRRSEQGTSVVRLIIDRDGKIGDCGIVSSSGSAVLDARTCDIFIKRAEFDPAIGADGQPVRSLVVTRISWRIG